jgi:DNA-binding MarR family transcriptional regulator
MPDASDFDAAFRAVYTALHRRDGPRSRLPAASWAVLHHLGLAGPLTVGELARHLARAQSVTSEIVGHLVSDGLLERQPDPADRRRQLVWLSAQGRGRLEDTTRVLEHALVQAALDQHPDPATLVAGLHRLAALAAPPT